MPTLDISSDFTRLVLRKGEDKDLDVEWWTKPGPAGLQIPIVEAWGSVKDKNDGTLLLDLAPYLVCEEGTAQLRIPGTLLATELALERGAWQLFGKSDSDQTTILLRGDVQIKEDV